MALAVPLSSNFAGEFLVLAGRLPAGLGLGGRRRGRDRARGDVHAAADLGRAAPGGRAGRERRGARPAPRRARDRRAAGRDPARPLGLAGRDQRPLVRHGHGPVPTRRPASAAPAARSPAGRVTRRHADAIDKPHVDWFALSPSLAMIAAAGAAAARRRVRAEASSRKPVSASRLRRRLRRPRSCSRSSLADQSPRRRGDRRRLDLPRPLGRASRRSCRRLRPRRRARSRTASAGARSTSAEYYALLAAAGAGMAFFVAGRRT